MIALSVKRVVSLLPFTVSVLTALGNECGYRSLCVVSADMIHHNVKCGSGIILNYIHYPLREFLRCAEAGELNYGVGKGIVHNIVELFSEQKAPPLTVGNFIGCVLPDLTEQYGVGINSLE